MGEIHTITLEKCDMADCTTTSTIVAQSTQEEDLPIRGRSHTLLYRTGNMDPDTASYQVCYMGIVPATETEKPKIEKKNLQLSARVYNGDILEDMPKTVCPVPA